MRGNARLKRIVGGKIMKENSPASGLISEMSKGRNRYGLQTEYSDEPNTGRAHWASYINS